MEALDEIQDEKFDIPKGIVVPHQTQITEQDEIVDKKE